MDHGGDGRTRREDARTRLESGEPLLRADDLAIDWNAFARLAQQVCRIAAKHRPDEANAFAELAAQFGTPARIEQMARDYLRYTQHALRSMPQSLNLQSLFSSSTTRCIHFLPRAREWQPLVDNASWYRAYCPICGGEPDFAALEKETGARRLLCSRCDFEWLFHRSICPFCGEDGIDKLGYYSSDDGVYRLYNCERCGRYLKTVDLRDLVRPVDLPAERVLTIGMDVAAMEVSYRG